jgi:orotate phosphoribosyltransferase
VLIELGKMFADRVTHMWIESPAPNWARSRWRPRRPSRAASRSSSCATRRKEYGTSKLVEGVLNRGETVLIVEDILTTGGQVLEAAKTLQDAGARVERIIAVIDRLEGARQNIESAGFVLESLFTTRDLGIE